MKKNFTLFLLLCTLVLSVVHPLQAGLHPAAPPTTEIPAGEQPATPQLLSRQDMEAQLGRKLKFKERLALSIVNKKLKKQAQKQARSGVPANEGDTEGMAVAGFIMGLLGWLLPIVGFICLILAIVFSAIALNRLRNGPPGRRGKGLATAGLVLGIVGISLLVLAIWALVFLV